MSASRRWRPSAWSLRTRITVLAGLVSAAALLVFGAIVVTIQERALTDALDERLAERADEIVRHEADGSLEDAGGPAAGDDEFLQVTTERGDVVWGNPAAAAEQRVSTAAPPASGSVVRTVARLPVARGDERDVAFRVLQRALPDRDLVVTVAAPLDDVEESVRVLRLTLAVALPLVLAGLVTGIWLLVGRSLGPVERIRAEVARIQGHDLTRRVPEPRADDEVGRLARTMNAMLDRLETAQRRQDRFVADAAHELRSPLTGMRAELEVDLAHPDAADVRATAARALEQTTRLERLVDDLLAIARLDDGGPRRRAPVDLDDLVFEEVAGIRPQTGVEVDTTRVTGAQVHGDREQLRRVVRNLLDNATRHARTRVTVELGDRGGAVELTVTDDGPGVPAAEAERIFERFARVDEARDRASGGAGLGLAIVREIVEEHGGDVSLEGADPTTFRVRLPIAGFRGGDRIR